MSCNGTDIIDDLTGADKCKPETTGSTPVHQMMLSLSLSYSSHSSKRTAMAAKVRHATHQHRCEHWCWVPATPTALWQLSCHALRTELGVLVAPLSPPRHATASEQALSLGTAACPRQPAQGPLLPLHSWRTPPAYSYVLRNSAYPNDAADPTGAEGLQELYCAVKAAGSSLTCQNDLNGKSGPSLSSPKQKWMGSSHQTAM